MLMADFADYVATQGKVDALWQQPQVWAGCAIRNVAAMGFFSSDRTIREYVEKIWVAPKR
jgi:glycogen phosphorylase